MTSIDYSVELDKLLFEAFGVDYKKVILPDEEIRKEIWDIHDSFKKLERKLGVIQCKSDSMSDRDELLSVNVGDIIPNRVRIITYIEGNLISNTDYLVEEFRYCLGFFTNKDNKTVRNFTRLCDLYEDDPDSKRKYISNNGESFTTDDGRNGCRYVSFF